MNKLCLILLTIPIYAAGCTSTFTVHVNGFSEFDAPISDKASIYVMVDPNSQNPIFDKEIKAKIEMLLKSHGYIPAPDVEQSDYRLAFQVGLDSHTVTGYTPLHRPYLVTIDIGDIIISATPDMSRILRHFMTSGS